MKANSNLRLIVSYLGQGLAFIHSLLIIIHCASQQVEMKDCIEVNPLMSPILESVLSLRWHCSLLK